MAMSLLRNPLNPPRTTAERPAPPKTGAALQQKPAVTALQKPAVGSQLNLTTAARRFDLQRNTSAFEGQVKDFSKVLGKAVPAQTAPAPTAAAQETAAPA